MLSVSIIGAGVAGLTCACELVNRGVMVTVYEQSSELGDSACSWYAGGMLAPWCERESAEALVVEQGVKALDWWSEHTDCTRQRGSLVLSMRRERNEIERFARLTSNHQWVDNDEIAELEPDLSGRFERGLFFPDEAHFDPRIVLRQLGEYLSIRGVEIQFNQAVQAQDCDTDFVIDCRGYSARDQLPTMRGVKGEMLLLHSRDISLSRPVRFVHPRYPVYIVPRGDGHFMLGATMIENNERDRITARSMLELLSAAYALHPSFGEADIIEIGVDVRPAFDNNLPTLFRKNNTLYVNGLFRHGFLLSPAMAIQAADAILNEQKYQGIESCVSS